MSDSLFQQLKRIGIDEDLACQVSASLDPDHNASKKDVLIMQEAILQVQAKGDERYNQLREESNRLRAESDQRYYQLKEDSNRLKADSDQRYYQLKEDSNRLKADSDQRYYQLRTESDKRYYQLREESNRLWAASDQKYQELKHELKNELVKGLTDVRIEFHSMHRHSIYAFGAILVSILTVLAVNIYFHL